MMASTPWTRIIRGCDDGRGVFLSYVGLGYVLQSRAGKEAFSVMSPSSGFQSSMYYLLIYSRLHLPPTRIDVTDI